jgi:hypothetical protein
MRINEIQAIHNQWESAVLPQEERTPRSRFDRMMEEVHEVVAEVDDFVDTPEKRKALAMEVIDVWIASMGLLDSLGFDPENLIAEKFDVVYRKYNPIQNAQLRENGMDHHEAMLYQKGIWQNGHD